MSRGHVFSDGNRLSWHIDLNRGGSGKDTHQTICAHWPRHFGPLTYRSQCFRPCIKFNNFKAIKPTEMMTTPVSVFSRQPRYVFLSHHLYWNTLKIQGAIASATVTARETLISSSPSPNTHWLKMNGTEWDTGQLHRLSRGRQAS